MRPKIIVTFSAIFSAVRDLNYLSIINCGYSMVRILKCKGIVRLYCTDLASGCVRSYSLSNALSNETGLHSDRPYVRASKRRRQAVPGWSWRLQPPAHRIFVADCGRTWLEVRTYHPSHARRLGAYVSKIHHLVRLLGITQSLSAPAPIARYPRYTLIDPGQLPSPGQASLDLATLSDSVPRLRAECILQEYRENYR